MKYKYFAAYKLEGIVPPQEGLGSLLIEFSALQLTVHISTEINEQLQELDKANAVRISIFEGRGDSDLTLEERLPLKIAEIKEKRRVNYGSGVFLFFQAGGDIQGFDPKQKHAYSDFIVVFDESPNREIINRYEQYINGVFTSFALTSEYVYQTHKVSEGIIYYDENSVPVYSFNLEAHGTIVMATPLTKEHINYVKRLSGKLAKHQSLKDISRLFSKSIKHDTDDLLRFLSVWSSLEIFINKNFTYYEKIAYSCLAEGIKGKIHCKFIDKVKEVMKKRYSLLDKFTMISMQLATDDSDNDIQTFMRLKDVRDRFMHGVNIEAKNLPTADVKSLLRKYLKLHIDHVKS